MKRILLAVLVISAILALDSLADVNVLVLTGNITQEEFPVLETFTNVAGVNVSYEQTNDRSLPGLNNADILWIGQGEICENAYFFDAATEDEIKSFVNSGGIVISAGQDSDTDRPCEVGWLTASALGIERSGTETFVLTDDPRASDLFSNPNNVTTAHFDDTWTEPDAQYIMLATINGQDIGVALLEHGSGMYIVTGIENESAGDVSTNTPIIENLMHYAVSSLLQTTAVEYRGKLAMSWGMIKSAY